MLVWAPSYNTDLEQFGLKKPFALDRGEQVLQTLAMEGVTPPVLDPSPLTLDQAKLVHDPAYLDSLKQSVTWMQIFELEPEEQKRLSGARPLPELLDDILLKCGGTLLACRTALKSRLAANLGGGYHHAFPREGRGFCVLNDIAIAVRCLQQEQLIERAMIVDVDFHQGDGTALIFQDDPSVFTLSIHSEEGWPEVKQRSSLDISIREHEAGEYQSRLEGGLMLALSEFSPDLVVFVAGSDAYELDVLPGTRFLRLSLEQMHHRDRFVLNCLADRSIPTAMVFAGGYGPHVWKVHLGAVRHMLVRAAVIS